MESPTKCVTWSALCLRAFRTVPRNSYVGINAAANSVLLGDVDAAKSLATEVEALVSGPQPKNYWEAATIAEVQLIDSSEKIVGDLGLRQLAK